MKLYRILLVMLVLAGHRGVAQTTEAPTEWPARRWSVGTQLAFYPRFAFVEAADERGIESVRPWPVMPAITYQIRQVGSFEVGLLLRTMPRRTATVADSYGTSIRQRSANSWAVPIIIRSHLPLPDRGRWQADFEIGFMPLAATYREESTYTDARTGQQSNSDMSTSYHDFLLVGGLGGAYALTPNLKLTADARVTFSLLLALVGSYLTNHGIDNNISAFAPALSTGVSYQFGKTL
ncbi:hypothetical protein GCM10028824_41120 [Hymenobacter segetis]|uniref:Outer membrane protein beta-barrel domain-containing protein n=1 Tax=Hymenobacter segetis TaxID=2025509 RepID=A0ABU9M022_9BACT